MSNKHIFVLVLVFVFSNFVFAQQGFDEIDKGEIFAGYSGAVLFTDGSSEPIENGFNASAVYNFRRYVGVKVDVSGTYKNLTRNYFPSANAASSVSLRGNHTLYNVTAGIQFKDNSRDTKFKPFAHVLAGYGRHSDKFDPCPAGGVCPPFSSDFNGTSLIVGGGVDIKVNRRLAVRLIQLDLNPIFYKSQGGGTEVYLSGRFSSGVVVNF